MKRYYITLISFLCFLLNHVGYTQPNQNYIRAETMLSPVKTQAAVNALPVSGKTTVYDYFDDLGRPIQQVVMQGSPGLKDVVKPMAYDAYGRQSFDYLPYVNSSSNGTYKPNALSGTMGYTSSGQYLFYQGTSKVASDSKPYGETFFEPSPLDRVLGSYPPGQAWGNPASGGGNKPIRFNYSANVASEVLCWKIETDGTLSLATGAYYAANELYKSTTTDEEGHKVIEYTDKRARVILKKVQVDGSPVETHHAGWASTYYVYDAFDDLRVVLPPEATRQLTSAGVAAYEQGGVTLLTTNKTFGTAESGDTKVYYYTPNVTVRMVPNFKPGVGFQLRVLTPRATNLFLNTWAFQYKYDGRRRMIEKKVPGAEHVYMVYDNRDRLVFTQDGNQRDASVTTGREWTFTKYDVLNRPIMTGVYTHSSAVSRTVMEGLVSTTVFHENYNGSTAHHGYTNTVFPTSGLAVHTVTYYDTYDFKTLLPAATFDYKNGVLSGLPSSWNNGVKEQVTGTKARILGSDDYLASVNYYDKYYRLVQNISHNVQLGIDILSNVYDFPGRILKTKTNHNYGSALSHTILREYEYDHASRLLETWHTHNGGTRVLLAANEYNELGELVDKKLHSEDNGSTYAQSVDYRYNIRGWLTRINDSGLSEAEPQAASDYFGMELGYNTSLPGVTATPAFNGNISAVKWSDDQGATQRAYAYGYDRMNRITSANHFKNSVSTPSFSVSGLGYDYNGNIKTLTRKDQAGNTMDALSYHYGSGTAQSNQLLSVSDGGNDNEGFKDGNSAGNDYLYDDNGNMTMDLNKGIGTITYNHLNLPQRVEKDANNYILYTYDGVGIKLRQQVYEEGALAKTTEYLGEFIYEAEGGAAPEIALIQHEEGRIVRDLVSGSYNYEYFLKDHLGNTRVVFTTAPETISFTATMESEEAASEEALFSNLPETRVSFSSAAQSPDEVAELDNLNPIGPALSLQVGAGDVVRMEGYAYFEGGSGYSSTAPLTSFAAAVAGAFGGVNGSGIPAEQATFDMFNNAYGIIGMQGTGSDAVPAAYLNYILFDQDMVYQRSGFKQISGTASFSKEYVAFPGDIVIDEPGYIYCFVSMESATGRVFWDDFRVTVVEHPVVQKEDYYPFGLTFNSFQRVTAKENRWKFNGKERIDDLDLNWDDFGARMYMPEIGRWGVIDPLADQMRRHSPYNYAFDNPIRFIDPDGMAPLDNIYLNEKGQEVAREENEEPDKYFVIKTTKTTDDLYPEGGDPNQRGNSNPISKAEAKETERELKAGNFEGEHMNNLVEIADTPTREAYDQVSRQDDGKGGDFIREPQNNVEYGARMENGEVVQARGTPQAGGGFVRGDWEMHTHPSGSYTAPDGTVYSSVQAPSRTDIDGARGTEYVIGRRSKTVYIYNRTGVVATLPQKYFVNQRIRRR